MKAVILAGGEGVRLRPLSCGTPKPLTTLFDRPVMAHTLELLKKHGIRDIAVTLCCMPQAFEDLFGDGSEYGVRLRWYREEKPLGTAGGAAACREFLDEDFLVISGDAVCDLDLSALTDFHRSRGAAATIALSRQADPLGYGLVQTGEDGRILRFAEKPAWDSVVTDAVNTGIYVLSPAVLDEIPTGRKSDFARDLFPRLLSEGRDFRAVTVPGYWCDMGTPAAYLRCVRDALAGRVALSLPPGEKGVFALSPVPADAVVTPPVYIGKNVSFGEGVRIGPYALIGGGSRIGSGASVAGSAVNGARVGREARIRDSILCRDASVGDGALLSGGCVAGERARIGDGARLHEGVSVWPEQSCPPGTELRFSLISRSPREFPAFDGDGRLTGMPDDGLTPERCLALGMAAAALAEGEARIGIGCENSSVCGLLAEALTCGVRAAGGRAVRATGGFAAAASFAAARGNLDMAFHVGENGEQVTIRLFAGDGLPPETDLLRRLERGARQSDLPRVPAEKVGQVTRMPGLLDDYCRAASAAGSAEGRICAVHGAALSPVLCNILWLMGARIAPRGPGRILWRLSPDGLRLTAADERGGELDDAHTLACAVRIALESEGEAALPFDAPAALDKMTAQSAGRVRRMDGSDAGIRALRARQRYLWDGAFRAARITAYLAHRGMTLAELASGLPAFARIGRELPLSSDRAGFMRAAAERLGTAAASYGRGLRVPLEGGWLVLAPLSGACAVRLWAESGSMEAARELCDGAADRLRQLDRDIKRRKIR